MTAIAMAMGTIIAIKYVSGTGWVDWLNVGEGDKEVFCGLELAVGASVVVEVFGFIGEGVGAGVVAWVGVGMEPDGGVTIGVGLGEGLGVAIGVRLGVGGGVRPVAKTVMPGVGE